MSDDRPLPSPVEELAALRRDFEDFKTTMAARASRMPTGTLLGTFLPAPPADTLFCQGQTITREEFPVLWTWIDTNSLHGAGKWFGTGDGSTTFVLPDLRNLVLVGAGGTWALGTKVGAVTDSIALVAGNMPQHGHSITGSVSGVGDHDHATTGAGGYHDNHFPEWGYDVLTNGAPGGAISGQLARQAGDGGRRPFNAHGHPMVWDGAHSHGHTLAAGASGSANPTPLTVDVVQPSGAINYMIFT